MIHLRTLDLEPFGIRRKGHYRLRRRLYEDQAVYNYISKHFDTFVVEPKSEDRYEIGKSYVITDQTRQVGMLGSINLDKNGIIDLWCAIDSSFRHHGYGEKALVQMTEYLEENMVSFKDIKLTISKANEYSNQTAISCGYNLVGHYQDKNIYQYFKR